VISMEDWVTIRNLKKRKPEMGTRKIAEFLGISRNTVRRALRSENYPGYNRASKVNKKLDVYAEFIKESYIIKKQRVSVIIGNLRSKGYDGSDVSVYRYISEKFKSEKELGKTRSFKPYETMPGEQMLFDWSEYSVNLGGIITKVYVHLTILGNSRYKVFNASLSVKQSDVFDALEESFYEIGGTCDRLQVDNARVFVDNASVNEFKWNKRFLNFCGYYGVKPTRSLPGHPWSKGKVENPFDYLENHFITNMIFHSFEDFCKKLKKFQEDVNNRNHSKLSKSPYEAYLKEQENLLELPQDRYIGIKEEFRKVTRDCLISYNGNRYSVPHIYAGNEVWVKIYKGAYLRVYSKVNKLIAEHKLVSGKGEVIIDKSHYKGYNSNSSIESFKLSSSKLKKRFKNYERLKDFLLCLKAQKHLNAEYHLSRIVQIFEDYSDEDCINCMEECLKYNKLSFYLVKGYLSANAKVELKIENFMLSEVLLPKGEVKRSLWEYRL